MNSITYLTTSFAPKGPTRQLSYMASGFAEEGWDVQLVSLRRARKGDFSHLFKSLSRVYGIICAVGRLRGSKVVHSSGILPDLICCVFVPKSAWVSTVRNALNEDYEPKFGTIKGRALSFLHKSILQRCCNVVFCSQELKEKIGVHGIKGRVVENASIDPPTNSREFSKQLVFCGSLIERKNIKLMCQFVGQTEFRNLTFNVFGTGKEVNQFATLGVNMWGFESDLNRIYDQPKIFISLSKSEGLPNSVLEAIAFRCILVLSNIPVHVEIAQRFPDLCILLDLEYPDFGSVEQEVEAKIAAYGSVDFGRISETYSSSYGQKRLIDELKVVYGSQQRAF